MEQAVRLRRILAQARSWRPARIAISGQRQKVLGSIQISLESAMHMPIFESIQSLNKVRIDQAMEKVMHPVGYLFEEIYRNYWGIVPAADARKVAFRARVMRPFRTERRR